MRILWLHQPGGEDARQVGVKAAMLSRLMTELNYLNIPPGFCVTHDALMEGLSTRGGSAELDRGVGEEISAAYGQLARMCGKSSLPVAVRPSGSAPDGLMTASSGPKRSFLNVAGARAVTESVGSSWNAANRRAKESGESAATSDDAAPQYGVLVQQLLVTDASIVATSVNVTTGDAAEMSIRANWGLGESLMGDGVDLDRYVVRKSDLRILSQHIGDKARMSTVQSGGVHLASTPDDLRYEPAMDNLEVVAVARLIRDVESVLRGPVEVECAVKDGRIHLLECRRILFDVEDVAIAPTEEVEWLTPDDARRTWHRVDDAAEPARPLLQSYLPYYTIACNDAAATTLRNQRAFRIRFVRGYGYVSVPPFAADEDADEGGNVTDSARPETPHRTGADAPLTSLSSAGLAQTLQATLTAQVPRFAAQAKRNAAGERLTRKLISWYRQRFPDRPETESLALLVGQRRSEVEAAHRLCETGALFAGNPPQLQRLWAGEIAKLPEERRNALERVRHAYDSLQSAVADPGAAPTENATTLWKWVARYAEAGVPDPEVRAAAAAADRDALLAQIRQDLTPEESAVFEPLLAATRRGYGELGHTIHGPDGEAAAELRTICGEIAARMVGDGALDMARDVAFLTLNELSLWAFGLSDPLQARIAARRAEHEENRKTPVPPMLGSLGGDSATGSTLWFEPAPSASTKSEIRGAAAAAGRHRGAVCILHAPDDDGAYRLKPGEILVCRATDPTWAPLFGMAGGIVADSGGVLSHAAMSAREFGIPAVVGTHFAAQRLKTGQIVEIDGDSGTVRLVS